MRNRIFVLLLVLSIFQTGCSTGDFQDISSTPEKKNVFSSDLDKMQTDLKDIQANDLDGSSQLTQQTNSKDLVQENIQDITGKITKIFYGKDNQILILADDLYLYDLITDTIKAQTKIPEFRQIRLELIDGGYVLIGLLPPEITNEKSENSSFNMNCTCILYNDNLVEKNKIPLKNFEGLMNIETITSDGKVILWADFGKVQKFDILLNKTTTILDFKKGSSSGLLAIEHLYLSKDDKKIIYKGQSEADNKNNPSVSSYGMMNIDGSGIFNKKNSKYNPGDVIKVVNNKMILPEDARNLTGRMLIMDLYTKKEKIITLSATKETNGRTEISNKGNYFATGEIKDDKYIIRIYSISDGNLLTTKIISDSNKEYFYRGSSIKLIEDTKTCIVSLGEWNRNVDTKLYTFGF